jgi:hypothetical protein
MSNTHKDFGRATHRSGPSDRNFGLVFTVAFAFFGLWPLRHHLPIRSWLLALSAATLLITLVRPSLLHPANRIWTTLGLLLGRVVNPIVMALLFYLVFTPVAILMRAMGKDPLRLAADPEADSYWIPRGAEDEMSNMNNQF